MNVSEKKSYSSTSRTAPNNTKKVSSQQLNDTIQHKKSQDRLHLDVQIELESKFEPKKKQSLLLSESYMRLGYEHKALKVADCGTFLEFAKYAVQSGGAKLLGSAESCAPTDSAFKLHNANFCRDRLCPMCSWRRSYKIYSQVSQIMNVIADKYVFLFLTLTVPNCTGDKLSSTITDINNSWNRLTGYKQFQNSVKGYFKALEVTRNKKADTYHPHLHNVLAVDKKYFKGKYISRDEWLSMWQKATRDNSITQVDIRRAKQKDIKNSVNAPDVSEQAQKALSSAVAEIAKYAVKSADYIFDNSKKQTDKVVSVLTPALANRRLCSFGGVFEDARKSLMLDDCENGDLIHLDDNKMNSELAVQIFRYGWSAGAYKLIDISSPTESGVI